MDKRKLQALINRQGRKTLYRGVVYRSLNEAMVAKALFDQGLLNKVKYEDHTIKYEQTLPRRYTPDFTLFCASGKKIYVECKGSDMEPAVKQKLTYIVKNNIIPLRFIFMSPHALMPGCSRETFASWAERLGAPWAEKRIPPEWFSE